MNTCNFALLKFKQNVGFINYFGSFFISYKNYFDSSKILSIFKVFKKKLF